MDNQEKLETKRTHDEERLNTIYVGHYYTQTNTYKTWVLLINFVSFLFLRTTHH